MRPNSIIMFERLFLASLALGLIGFAISYEEATAMVANDPAAMQLGLGSEFLIGATLFGYAIYLLLWFLIARKASNVAKWILVVFTVLGVLAALPSLGGPWGLANLLALAVYVLGVAAVVYLFRQDARAWFKGKGQADPATFG